MGTLKSYIDETLKEKLAGEVTFKDIDITIFNHFPHFSLELNDIVVEDPRIDEHHLQIFTADRVYVQIRILSLLKKKIELRAITVTHANLNIIRLSDGILNSKSLIIPNNTDNSEANPDAILISKLYLKDVHIQYRDTLFGKDYNLEIEDSYGRLNHSGDVSTITTKDKIFVHGLTFKPDRGSCLTDKTIHTKLNLEWNRADHVVYIKPSNAEMDKKDFSLEGSISPGLTPYLNLDVATKEIRMDYATTLVSDYSREKLDGFNFAEGFPANLHIEGPFNPGLPMDIDIYFNVKENTFTTKTKTIAVDSLVGHYYNHLVDTLINNEANSGISFTDFAGSYEGIPFLMDMRVTDLTNPYMALHINSDVRMPETNSAIDTTTIIFTGGSLILDVNFKGKVYGYLEKEKDSMDAEIKGTAQIKNVSCRFPQKKYTMENMNGNIAFNEKSLYITAMDIVVNKNALSLTADVSDFIYLFFFPNAKLQANAVVTTNKFNLDNFKKPGLAKKQTQKPEKKISNAVNSVLENLKGNLKVDAKEITFHKFKANNVKGNITIGNTYISCKELTARVAEGNIKISGDITGIGSEKTSVNLNTNVGDANIREIFSSLDNFNQTAITSKNIKGKLDANVNINMNLTSEFKVKPESMKGNISMTVKGGELINMDALNQISKNVFKKKDFSDIQFAELNMETEIDGSEFNISRMEIQSNVLTLYVDGVYSFQDKTELYIQIPIKSLKSQDEYIAENKQKDDKVGMSINLKATTQDGKIKILPLLFHKKDK